MIALPTSRPYPTTASEQAKGLPSKRERDSYPTTEEDDGFSSAERRSAGAPVLRVCREATEWSQTGSGGQHGCGKASYYCTGST